jgi:acetylornithine/succinyldiaminopimelate/putrescine aminotransferase
MDFHKGSCTFRFFPPYVIASDEIDSFIAAFGETLSSLGTDACTNQGSV